MSVLQQRAKQLFSAESQTLNQTILCRTDLELVTLAKENIPYTIAQILAVEFVEIPNLEYYI